MGFNSFFGKRQPHPPKINDQQQPTTKPNVATATTVPVALIVSCALALTASGSISPASRRGWLERLTKVFVGRCLAI